jgi:hypothetical protein
MSEGRLPIPRLLARLCLELGEVVPNGGARTGNVTDVGDAITRDLTGDYLDGPAMLENRAVTRHRPTQTPPHGPMEYRD